MKRTIITAIFSLAFAAFAIHARDQTAFKGAGIIESTAGGFRFPDGSVQLSAAELVTPITGHDKIFLFAVSTAVQETVTFTQRVMLRHVQFSLQKVGDPGDRCFISARKTNPSEDSFLEAQYFVGNEGYEIGQFNLGSGVEFQTGEDMTVFANAPDSVSNECYVNFIYFFDILD